MLKVKTKTKSVKMQLFILNSSGKQNDGRGVLTLTDAAQISLPSCMAITTKAVREASASLPRTSPWNEGQINILLLIQ